MVYLFLAEGFEDLEALAPVDILRRSGTEVLTVAVGGNPVRSKSGVLVTADKTIQEIDLKEASGIILPGGLQGVNNLENEPLVCEMIRQTVHSGRLVAAICAAPALLGRMGLLDGKHAVCFPGFEKDMKGAKLCPDEWVVQDGNIITARGAGVSLEFGFKLAEVLCSAETAEKIASEMQFINHAKKFD